MRTVSGYDFFNRAGIFTVDPFLDRSLEFRVTNLTQLFLVFEQPQPGAHDLANVVETP